MRRTVETTPSHTGEDEHTERSLPEDDSDSALAEWFASRVEGHLLWNESDRSWLVYEGGFWRNDDVRAFEHFANEARRQLILQAADTTIVDGQKLLKIANTLSRRSRLKSMIEGAKAHLPVRPTAFDSNSHLLGLENGVLDLTARKLFDHGSSLLMKKRAKYKYEPETECPEWLTFLTTIMSGDKEMIEFLRRLFGHCLIGTPGNPYLFIFYGTGANGKSTIVNVLSRLLGDYAIPAMTNVFTGSIRAELSWPLVPMVNARLVVISESGQTNVLDEHLVKVVTGGDPVTVAAKYGHPFTFTPVFKPVMMTNHLPKIVSQDEGIWRRLMNIEFDVSIPFDDRIEDYAGKILYPELPGILNWALDGLEDYLDVGLLPPEKVQAATRRYRSDMDILGEWIDSRCEGGGDLKERFGVLYEDYSSFSKSQGDGPISRKQFSTELTARNVKIARGAGNVSFAQGIRLKSS